MYFNSPILVVPWIWADQGRDDFVVGGVLAYQLKKLDQSLAKTCLVKTLAIPTCIDAIPHLLYKH